MNYKDIALIANTKYRPKDVLYPHEITDDEVERVLKAAILDEVLIQTTVCEILEMPKVYNGEGYV